MLKASFRKKTRGVDVRIGILFSKFGINPNTWTMLSLAPALIGFLALAYGNLGLGLIFFVLSAFMDIIDGTVARVTNSVSNLGAFLDGVVDRYVELALYLGLWFYIQGIPTIILPHGLWFILLIFGALMPSFITAYADHRNVINDPDRLKNIGGLMERFERLAVIYFGMFLGLINPLWLMYVLILTVFLANLTAIQRIVNVTTLKHS
jgi:archaetidylinositol phosphate synthase